MESIFVWTVGDVVRIALLVLCLVVFIVGLTITTIKDKLRAVRVRRKKQASTHNTEVRDDSPMP